jgi:hypothetical protein
MTYYKWFIGILIGILENASNVSRSVSLADNKTVKWCKKSASETHEKEGEPCGGPPLVAALFRSKKFFCSTFIFI